ncbi:Uncharacterized protein HZ326_10518 [Fusarium oxysporum f. sp. albedinis]|nr:Uncharacterized protein HZ326_10518 [Fusarium oxysporum f. sp. albedinis]
MQGVKSSHCGVALKTHKNDPNCRNGVIMADDVCEHLTRDQKTCELGDSSCIHSGFFVFPCLGFLFVLFLGRGCLCGIVKCRGKNRKMMASVH